MADLRLDDGNFCIGTYVGTFCSIDEANDRLVTRNSSNAPVGTQYSLDTLISSTVLSLEYTGPRDLTANDMGGPLPFFSLSSDRIRQWILDDASGELDQYTVSSGISGNNYSAMAVEHYYTSFSTPTITGTGKIQITDDSNIDVGTELLLGPSADASNMYAYEFVEVTNIAGGWVYITASGLAPPHNEYLSGDEITFAKYLYLFSDDGYLHKRNLDYSIVETITSDVYANVSAAAWSNSYNAIGFTKDEGVNLLYIDPYQDYQVIKSHTLNNVRADNESIWTVSDLAFDGLTLYRLQLGQTMVDDDGAYSDTNWSPSYSYHQDTISPYTKNITVYAEPDGVVLGTDTVTLTAVIRDQYGVGLLSKLVYFFRSGDSGDFTPLNGQVYTNASGIASLTYTTVYYDPEGAAPDFGDIVITARTDGASTLTGSQYVWDGMSLQLYKRFRAASDDFIEQKQTLSGTWPVEGDDLYTQTYLEQLESVTTDVYMDQKSKFQFPGGDWIVTGAPNDSTTIITQLNEFSSSSDLEQIDHEFDIDTYLEQWKQQSNTGQVSQTYVSRHVLNSHYDTTDIDQFRFVEDAIPAFWSEKNPVSTNIWIRLRPFAYSLNQSSLVFKVKEISYAGDTGWQDVTSSCAISTFDAGGGLLGLDILYNPPIDFHHNAIVYVDILVYDNAPTPNIIVTDYWFKIIPDYKAPYIDNEIPSRGEENVVINTDISFDVFDAGVGVDIDTLEFYVNNRQKTPVITEISGGYHVYYNPPDDFYYGQTVEITVKVKDASDYENTLRDMWRFYIEGSTGPWIDIDSFYPANCRRGIPRKVSEISFNVYGINDTGVDESSIIVHIGGKERDVTITPIIYRIS